MTESVGDALLKGIAGVCIKLGNLCPIAGFDRNMRISALEYFVDNGSLDD